jgi:hypothetical protein
MRRIEACRKKNLRDQNRIVVNRMQKLNSVLSLTEGGTEYRPVANRIQNLNKACRNQNTEV